MGARGTGVVIVGVASSDDARGGGDVTAERAGLCGAGAGDEAPRAAALAALSPF
jgi:hypothetical protein